MKITLIRYLASYKQCFFSVDGVVGKKKISLTAESSSVTSLHALKKAGNGTTSEDVCLLSA